MVVAEGSTFHEVSIIYFICSFFFLPSGLFVVVSWISFVVPPDVIPGRMALLITLFLVLVNIFNNVTTNTPKAKGKQVPLHFFIEYSVLPSGFSDLAFSGRSGFSGLKRC